MVFPCMGSHGVSSPPSRHFGGRVGVRALASVGDSASSSLMRVAVAGSSRSQESLVLADPSPVASSVSAGRDCWSRSREIGESPGDRSRSSRSSPSRDSREGHRCARSRSWWSRDRSRESCSHSTDCSRSRGRRRSRRDSSLFPSAHVQSQRFQPRSSACCWYRRVCSRSRSDRSQSRRLHSHSPGLRDHTGPATGRRTARPFLLTVRGLGNVVGGLGGVARIERRQLLPPGVAATLGREWSLPLWLWVAPFLYSRPLCRTLPSCSSACQGPWRSGMRPWGLYFRLLLSPVLG